MGQKKLTIQRLKDKRGEREEEGKFERIVENRKGREDREIDREE